MADRKNRISNDDRTAPGLWEFVPLADYERPEPRVGSMAAQTWASFKRVLRRNTGRSESPVRLEDDLRVMPDVRLAHLVHPIDWAEVSHALDRALSEHRRPDDDESRVRFVIGQPHCGHAEIVQGWAARHGAPVLEPPRVQEILAGGDRWFATSIPQTGAWALPRLEHCFLRHASGLHLVRRVLEAVSEGRAGDAIIGCDSWAWAYLQRVWPMQTPRAMTLQAFDGEDLSALFAQLASVRRSRSLRFCNAHSGRETLTIPRNADGSGEELVTLAAHCRGNPGVARFYWRNSLRAEPDAHGEDLDDTRAANDTRGGTPAREDVVWVSSRLGGPELPIEGAEDVALVLHAVLMHAGLSTDALHAVLPLPAHQTMSVVLELRQQGVLERCGDRWSVAPLSYIPVRQWLRGRDYLTDAF